MERKTVTGCRYFLFFLINDEFLINNGSLKNITHFIFNLLQLIGPALSTGLGLTSISGTTFKHYEAVNLHSK